MQAIGIDIGTTSICAVVLDTENGRVVKSITKNSDAFIKGCALWEKIQSVEKIILLAATIADECITPETAVIGVTGQMHGIVYTDINGEAVSPLYTWQDERGNLPYKDTTYAKYLGSFAGYGNVTDFYNRENDIRPANAVSYCTIHDYFVMKLCGLKMPIIHTSDAASFGCYDIEKSKFNCDFNADIVTNYKIAGCYKGIPVSVAIGDNQASVFSTLTDDAVLINVGTGSQVSVVSDIPVYEDNIETRPYFEGKYLVVGAALCGGRAYSMLKDFYAEIMSYKGETDETDVYAFMNGLLTKTEKATLKVDTRFAGTRYDSRIKGSITEITTENFNPREITYGVLDGMVSELYNMYDKMGVKINSIVGSGNGIRKNPYLAKIAEERFSAKLRIPAHTEEAAVGAALFGLVSCGVFDNAKKAQKLIKYEEDLK